MQRTKCLTWRTFGFRTGFISDFRNERFVNGGCEGVNETNCRTAGGRTHENLPLVPDVEQWLPGREPAQVFDEHARVPFRDARRVSGDVRREDDVRKAPERVVGRQRL